jgi:hypothetical protein
MEQGLGAEYEISKEKTQALAASLKNPLVKIYMNNATKIF